MCVDLVRGKQPYFIQLMKTCQMHRGNCAVNTLVETKRKKKSRQVVNIYILYSKRGNSKSVWLWATTMNP